LYSFKSFLITVFYTANNGADSINRATDVITSHDPKRSN